MNIDMDKLLTSLENLYEAENKVVEIITNTGIRFSPNKMTGDLGEFYVFYHFSKRKDLFETLYCSNVSNGEFDLFGMLSKDSVLNQHFPYLDRLRIEVKTRRNQTGPKYLSAVKPDQFDLLCVVDMAQNYLLNSIFLVTGEIVEKHWDKKRQRLVFREEMAFLSYSY